MLKNLRVRGYMSSAFSKMFQDKNIIIVYIVGREGDKMIKHVTANTDERCIGVHYAVLASFL